ncbi:MAG TPA: lytic murein transglycosylase [Gaiellaceae bacterium]|nr:lytic murein transglycosylase [Gaiellaceae bacterium]
MKPGVAVAVLVAVLALAGGAAAQSFTIVPATATALPSAEAPNAPGSIDAPYPLSVPPPSPAVRSSDEILALWHRAGDAYGIPWQVLGAINKIESNFGRNVGPSSAGAVGWMQFMPETWQRWGLDANGDGLADPWNPDDAVFAAARYLAAAGGRDDIARAVFAYNHAQWYVDEVLALAADFGDGEGLDLGSSAGPTAVFLLDDLQEQIAAARHAVASARAALPHLEREADRSVDRQLALELKAGDPTISTEHFRELEARISRLRHEQSRDTRRLERRRADLSGAVARLQSLQTKLTAASVAAPAAAAVGGAQSNGDYVFPVGGGPDAVTVAHTHHDYPAADIAAPEGSPLYALADSVVVDTFSDGRCGIGLQLQLDDGVIYTYCHLSYLEPSIVAGAALAAGAPVGLVGSTGDATGPHLHLQLAPPVSYPQDEEWFRSFAGVAFSWQDAPTPARRVGPPEPRFTVVEISRDSSAPRIVGFTR